MKNSRYQFMRYNHNRPAQLDEIVIPISFIRETMQIKKITGLQAHAFASHAQAYTSGLLKGMMRKANRAEG